MPIYNFKCVECDHEFEHSCKISEREEFIANGSCPESNPTKNCNLKQILSKVNFGTDPLGHSRVPIEFKEKVLDRLPSVGRQVGGKRESRLNFEK